MLWWWLQLLKHLLPPSQDLRVSIITYSCKGNIIVPITGDR
ncbi:Predicted gene, 30083 [Apodemus speciosus]|uniref:Predicted gene, 30083 n=1 Tax=Apodemus speciosus TaxID=105296 RepID=A0ABQ0FHI4_APOSI